MSIPCARASSTLFGAYGSPFSHIVPESGFWKPDRDLDQRRLAGAVVAEQPKHLALAQVQVDVAQRADRPEALRDVLDAEHVVVGRARPDDLLDGRVSVVSHGLTPSARGRRMC